MLQKKSILIMSNRTQQNKSKILCRVSMDILFIFLNCRPSVTTLQLDHVNFFFYSKYLMNNHNEINFLFQSYPWLFMQHRKHRKVHEIYLLPRKNSVWKTFTRESARVHVVCARKTFFASSYSVSSHGMFTCSQEQHQKMYINRKNHYKRLFFFQIE